MYNLYNVIVIIHVQVYTQCTLVHVLGGDVLCPVFEYL